MDENVLNGISLERKNLISYLQDLISKKGDFVISNYHLNLLLFNIGKISTSSHDELVWLQIYKNIVGHNNEKFQVMDRAFFKENELLLLELGESEEEISRNIQKYEKIIKQSQDTIGLRLDYNELQELLKMANNYAPDSKEIEELYDSLKPGKKII